MPICRDCGDKFKKNPMATNQKRCNPCMAKNPTRGSRTHITYGDRYCNRTRLWMYCNMKRWRKEDGPEKLKELFPDVVQVGTES